MMEILEVSYALRQVLPSFVSRCLVAGIARLLIAFPTRTKTKKKKLCYFALPNLKRKVDRFMLLLLCSFK